MGAPVVTPLVIAERVENALRAYVRLGSIPKASAETGIAQSTLYDWRKEHSERVRELSEEATRARTDLVAAEAQALTESLCKGRPVLDSLIDDPGMDPRVRIQAFVALANVSARMDAQNRLDRGEPTAIGSGDPRDATALDAELTKVMREIEKRGILKAAS